MIINCIIGFGIGLWAVLIWQGFVLADQIRRLDSIEERLKTLEHYRDYPKSCHQSNG